MEFGLFVQAHVPRHEVEADPEGAEHSRIMRELEVAQLRQALQSRDVIGQAKGILMERRGISADEAFDVLRRASQSLNIKLTTVAQTLVDRRAEI